MASLNKDRLRTIDNSGKIQILPFLQFTNLTSQVMSTGLQRINLHVEAEEL